MDLDESRALQEQAANHTRRKRLRCYSTRFVLGAVAGVILYLEVLVASVATGGTTSWAYPDGSCEADKVVHDGVATFPTCPSAAQTRWAQRALNWPADAFHSYWPSLGVRPQELRLPPHGDAAQESRWRTWPWLLTGATIYAVLGSLVIGLGALVVATLFRRPRVAENVTNAAVSRLAQGASGVGRVAAIALAAATFAVPLVWLLASGPGDLASQGSRKRPSLRPLTQGPQQHFFGYYDKLQFDEQDRYVLGLATSAENRTVWPSDRVEIGMIDLDSKEQNWNILGESRAWNWQQGCMLQWIPNGRHEIIWNDRERGEERSRFVSRIMNVSTKAIRTIPSPVYTLSPDGSTALSINFSRLQRARPSYGYVGISDPSNGVLAPANDGIFNVDLETGEANLIVPIATVAKLGRSPDYIPDKEHFFEMLQYNPSGTRFVFFERRFPGLLQSRMLTANVDGTDIYLLSDGPGSLSHVAWLDDVHISVFAGGHEGYAIFKDHQGYVSTLLKTSRDGHQTFFAGNEWMVSDTYADDDRLQHLFLYHLPSETTFSVADLAAEAGFDGDLRCDNHPRISRDGRRLIVDSAHSGGRQMYIVDIDEILDAGVPR